MFLFGRVGDYDTWPGDWEKCQAITDVMSDYDDSYDMMMMMIIIMILIW